MPILTKSNPLFTSPASNLSPEQDALRWRALVERVQRLEQQLGKTVKYGQVGAPGGSDLIAQRLRDAGSRFLIDLGNTLATVSDTSGTIRAQMGNLPANGISPAQYGFRANNASGVPIFDSLGLIAVMSQLGRGDQAFGFSYTNNTTSYTAITGDSVTFSLTRAARVLALFVVVFQSLTAGVTGEVDLFADGVNIPDAPTLNNADSTCWTSTSAITTAMNFYTATLAAGSHTIDLRGRVQSAGNTLQVNGSTIIVYLLGT